jgi:hypothetical protein
MGADPFSGGPSSDPNRTAQSGNNQNPFGGYQYYRAQVDPEELFRKIFGDAFNRAGFGNHDWMNEPDESFQGREGISQVSSAATKRTRRTFLVVGRRSDLPRIDSWLQQGCERAYRGFLSVLQGYTLCTGITVSTMSNLQRDRHGNYCHWSFLSACHLSNVSWTARNDS